MNDTGHRPIQAEILQTRPMSVTRKMAADFPRLRAMAEERGLKLHHLGAGYPHPEVSSPDRYIAQKEAYFDHLARQRDPSDPGGARQNLLMELYNYGDTLGPRSTREAFARVYGHDFGFEMDPDRLIPTMGATGGIAITCSLFERYGGPLAYIVDAPTYTGFVSRASLYQKARFYSVPMDEEGPIPEAFRAQIEKARDDGNFVPLYYTVPDGHNPGGISFSQARRLEILEIVREEGLLIAEDAPYTYISYEDEASRPSPFIALDPHHTIHLFTASKIGLPGPRVGFLYTEADAVVAGGKRVSFKDLLVIESAGDLLFHNPEALVGFEAYLMDEEMRPRDSLWPVAATKNAVYGENRRILLEGLQAMLGDYPELFAWTRPGAGFFTVFTFKGGKVRTDAAFVEKLIARYGVVTIPMFGFYPDDARERDPSAGFDQLRLSFSYNEQRGEGRRRDMEEAVQAFANAVRVESGLAPMG